VVVAIDVGGTGIKAGLVGPDGVARYEIRRATQAERGPEAVVAAIGAVSDELVAAGATRGETVRAIGIGVPGIVDSRTGIAHYAANLGWRDVPFALLLAQRAGVPAILAHDVRNGALAEARFGAGVGRTSVYFVAIGTGIAGGSVIEGRVDDGATGQAGEIGHLVVRPGGPVCGCGNRGCLEAVASASRIASRYADQTGVAAGSVSAQAVAERVAGGESAAIAVWTEAVAALADALAALIVLTDPGCIVIGGGLALAGPTLFDPLIATLPSRLTFRAPPEVLPARLGDRAGMIGAALRAWDLVDVPVAVNGPSGPPGVPGPGVGSAASPPLQAPITVPLAAPTTGPTAGPTAAPTTGPTTDATIGATTAQITAARVL
jgi:glucokinase